MVSKDLIVVGIGSSAGGLEALQIVLSKVETIDRCAFIIAQHLSPTHKSMMTDLLSRITNLPVLEIKNAMAIKPKTIYMTPENNDVYVSNGKIYLTNVEQAFGPKPSVNYFFNSLAQAFGNKAIGIILSGTGSDGAFGIRAIKANGGITIAQSPSTSKYDGMPVSAINTGKVDLVVPVDSISYEIGRIVENLDISVGENINEDISSQLFHIIFNEKGVDFSQYKKSTIIRRIERRLATLKIASLNEYVDYLKANNQEITNLYNDILIGVTEFFRDEDVFLKAHQYLQHILENKEQGSEIRLWSIGCSTGEEAYSLAILISEILGNNIDKYKIKIFATDIDDEALKIARSGIYAETSLVHMKQEYIQKYFVVQKNHFEIKKSIRELVIFSKHNITSDSPFLRIDFMSCRNMLIYFNQDLQNRFFPIAHYSLKENGILMLGKSESVGNNLDLFVNLDKQEKIFKAQYTGVKEPPKLYNYHNQYKQYEEPTQIIEKKEEEILEDKIVEATLAFMLDQCVVINSSNEIIYTKGKIPYLAHSQGKSTNNIFKCINEELVLDLRSALHQAQKQQKTKTTPVHSVMLLETVERFVKIVVIPLPQGKNDDFIYALFFQTEDPTNMHHISHDKSSESETVKKLTKELERTKAHLQNVIEELETSYEEMQSLNEELSSSNEELQSTNEELETTNEELQSTNEELQTAYTELKIIYDDKELKARKLEEITSTLQTQQNSMKKQQELTDTIIETVPVGIIMLDKDGRMTLMNYNAKKILNIESYDLSHTVKSKEVQVLIENNLPFELIKKTHEPIHKIEHTIYKDKNSKIYITVNGVPIFDETGQFLGAVFSIIDNLSVSNLTAISNETHALNMDIQFDIVQIGMLDITSNLKDYTNDLSFLTQTINDSSTDTQSKIKLQQNINTIIVDINTIIDSNINYYKDLFFVTSTNFVALTKRYIKIFENILISNNIKLIDNFDIKLDIKCDPKQASILIINTISLLIQTTKLLKVSTQLDINISLNTSNDEIVFDFVDTNISLLKHNDIFQNTKINRIDKVVEKIVLKDNFNSELSLTLE
jgi:two-component system, chemotaxis family, CheB/CheR fusion protein